MINSLVKNIIIIYFAVSFNFINFRLFFNLKFKNHYSFNQFIEEVHYVR